MFTNRIIIVEDDIFDHETSIASLIKENMEDIYDFNVDIWSCKQFMSNELLINDDLLFIVLCHHDNPIAVKYKNRSKSILKNEKLYMGIKDNFALLIADNYSSLFNISVYFWHKKFDHFISINYPDYIELQNKKEYYHAIKFWKHFGLDEENYNKIIYNVSGMNDSDHLRLEESLANLDEEESSAQELNKTSEKEFYEIDEGIWKIKYFDEEAIIKDSTGLKYCYYVLSRPDRTISLTEIFCGVNDEDPNFIAPLIEGAVIDKNANKTVVENLIDDYNEKILIYKRARFIILQEEDALSGIFHDGDVDLDAIKPISKYDKEKEEKRILKAKELSQRYFNSVNRLERKLEAFEDIVNELNAQLEHQPKEVSNERNKYASRIRMGFSNFYKLLKEKAT